MPETEVLRTPAIRSFRQLEVYQESFRLAMEIFKMARQFPQIEQYSLTTQMRNASRSIPANIAEGWSKRRHELQDSLTEAYEVLGRRLHQLLTIWKAYR